MKYWFYISILLSVFCCKNCIAQNSHVTSHFLFHQQKIDSFLTSGEIDSASYAIDAALKENSQYPPIENYFFKARKMEVNYYYDLGKLGLVDAKKNLDWALSQKNATMIADAYNFTGLFYFILGNWDQSVISFKNGLAYIKPQHSLPYFPSESYHLQNNLAEAFLKLGEIDSALKYCTTAMQTAKSKNDTRMTALSAYQIAIVLTEKGESKAADSLLQIALHIANVHEYNDVALICLGSLSLNDNLSTAQRKMNIDEGFKLLQQNLSINPFYAKDFYKQALTYYEKNGNYIAQTNILKQIAAIEDRKKTKELNYLINQYDEVISENEKRIELEKSNLLKSKEIQRQIIITALVSILVLIALVIIFFLRVRRKDAILNIRSSISRDLHDDLGSSLSSLNIYSTLLTNTDVLPEEKQKDVSKKIATISKDLMNNLHDIIWSLDKNKQQTSLEDLLKSYAMNMLTNKNIQLDIQILSPVESVLTSPKARKNMLMVLKEIMNNCSKYSGASSFSLRMFLQKNHLYIHTKDDGKGFDVVTEQHGNGLKNIHKRMKELNGTIRVLSNNENGTEINMRIPFQNVRMKEYFLKPIFTNYSRLEKPH